MKSNRILTLLLPLTLIFLLMYSTPGYALSPSMDSTRQQSIQLFKPYLKSVDWIRDLVKTAPESERARHLSDLTQLDTSWLDQAQFSNQIPTEWCGFWDNILGHSIDLFPHNVLRRDLLRVMATAAHQDKILIALKTLFDTEVILLQKLPNSDGPKCQLFELNPEPYQDPEFDYLEQRKSSIPQIIPQYLYGNYVKENGFFSTNKQKTTIAKDKIFALNRTWIIKSRGAIFHGGLRAYRLYALDEKNGMPGYFLLKKRGIYTDTWRVMLTVEDSPIVGSSSIHWLGAKYGSISQLRNKLFPLLVLAIISAFFYWIYRRRLAVIQRERSRTELALNGLRAQLNPHFLFNSLASIQDLMNEEKKEDANRYFDEIARLLRYVVDSSKYAYMPLAQELQALEKYCSLEALRTPFQYSFDISKDIDQNNTEIPTMLLQPFVENAILHGLRPGTDPKELKISLWPESGNRIGITVEDNGIGIEEGQRRRQKLQDTREHQGLATTQQRIDLLNEGKKEKITLQITDRSRLKPGQTGTVVQLSIPV